MSKFCTTLFKLCGTKIKLSIAYDYVTGGQTKRTNITFEDMLMMYVGKRQQLWDKWLHMIEFSYNDHIYSSIGVSLFYVLYGHEYRTPVTLSTPNTRFESINDMIREMNEIRESTKLAMKSAQDRAKYYVDNKRVFREFEVDDVVFLKVAPNRYGLKFGKSRKLSPRFCGPFENLKRIAKVAYELKLLEDWKIHNVFHVGLLRKYVFDPNHILSDLPKVAYEGELLVDSIFINIKICILLKKVIL